MTRLLDDRVIRLFIGLAAFFCVNAVLAEFIGVKIFALEDTLGIAPLQWNLFGQTMVPAVKLSEPLWPNRLHCSGAMPSVSSSAKILTPMNSARIAFA